MQCCSVLQQGWERKDHPNVHFVWYEDMKKDYRKFLTGLQGFLGLPASCLEGNALEELIERTSLDSMRQRAVKAGEAPNLTRKHFRKGQVNGYKAELDQKLVARIDGWIADNLKGTDIKSL